MSISCIDNGVSKITHKYSDEFWEGLIVIERYESTRVQEIEGEEKRLGSKTLVLIYSTSP